MPSYEGYADPAFEKELSKIPPRDSRSIRAALRELADDPLSHPRDRGVEIARKHQAPVRRLPRPRTRSPAAPTHPLHDPLQEKARHRLRCGHPAP